jgi:hypothetical protein
MLKKNSFYVGSNLCSILGQTHNPSKYMRLTPHIFLFQKYAINTTHFSVSEYAKLDLIAEIYYWKFIESIQHTLITIWIIICQFTS